MKVISSKKNTSFFWYYITCLSLMFCALTLQKVAYAKDNLIMGVHPYLSNTEIIKKFKPMADYLSDKTGMPIKVKVGSSYAEHIEYIGLNKVDIAYMGPASYVNMVEKHGEKPTLARLEINGNPWFQGNIIARKNNGITSINDLKNKRIAFGDPNSTMSYIVPHFMLHEAGIFTRHHPKHQFLNNHNNVALAVLSGNFDAGAVKPAVFKKFEAQGLQVIAKTPKISEHLFVTRSDMPSRQVEVLRQAMLEMRHSKQGLDALHAIKSSITGLVETSTDDYENLREIILESSEP